MSQWKHIVITCDNCGHKWRLLLQWGAEELITANKCRVTCQKCNHKVVLNRNNALIEDSSFNLIKSLNDRFI